MEFLELTGAVFVGGFFAFVGGNLFMIRLVQSKRASAQKKQVEKLADMLRRVEGAEGDK